ncbi:hypothetical protein Javan69_0013 [Streptococcus phage Javan69]|nr:hypothetical protein Javan69_0013 [Streptococcus phage Javan69]
MTKIDTNTPHIGQLSWSCGRDMTYKVLASWFDSKRGLGHLCGV